MVRFKSVVFSASIAASLALTAGLSFYKIAIGNAYRVFYEMPDVAVPAPLVGGHAVARGDRMVALLGCRDCHGASGEGRDLSDLARGVVLVAPPLFGASGRVTTNSDEALWRILRLGVDAERRALWAMPREALLRLKDDDVAAIVASLRTSAEMHLQVTAAKLARSHLTSWGYVQVALRRLWLIERRSPDDAQAHEAWDVPAPVVPGLARGLYLAAVGRCLQCHVAPGATPRVNLASLPAGPPLAEALRDGNDAVSFAAAWRNSGCRTTGTGWTDPTPVSRASGFAADEQREVHAALRQILLAR